MKLYLSHQIVSVGWQRNARDVSEKRLLGGQILGPDLLKETQNVLDVTCEVDDRARMRQIHCLKPALL